MAKRPTKEVVLTKEQRIEKAYNEFINDFSRAPFEVQPKPTRCFEIGEQVAVGNLDNVFIQKMVHDGMAYIYSCDWYVKHDEYGRRLSDPVPVTDYRCDWWFNIDKKLDNRHVPRLFTDDRRFSVTHSTIDSIIHFFNSGGLVCDPEYQREYVWSEANKDALLDSIFERINIGSFLFVRHAGFNHKGDSSLKTYRTLSGEIVDVQRDKDYTTSIIDGQQRLTTIVDFIQGRRPYRGVYFSQLNGRDQHEFFDSPVGFCTIEENQVTKKEILRMFLQANRGVPQMPEHIAKIQALYDAERD